MNSNQHFHNKSKNEAPWKKSPVICKISDFGESHSILIQTQSLLRTRVINFDRGTPVYTCPELLLKEKRVSKATVEDLMKADVWSFGMVLFVVLNTDLAYPYQNELNDEMKFYEISFGKEFTQKNHQSTLLKEKDIGIDCVSCMKNVQTSIEKKDCSQ